MEVLLKIKNATPGNIKIKLNKALKRLGTDFHIEKCIKIRKSEKGRKLQGRINFQGLNISIENRKGSIRYGIDSDGHSWKTKMNYPYGRIIGVQRLGHDGDHIDCYVGDNRQSDKVYIIHIKNCVTGKYDEDKIMLGFNNQKEVITAFKTQYDNFSKIFDGIEKMSIYEFKECLKKKTKSIIVKLKDFTRENADYKVIKALAGVGKALNCDFICKSINHAEKPSYQALQDIIDNSNAEVEKIKRQAYNLICKFLGLPKINKISKSITDELTVNGKIIFDPLYGKPLKQKDFAQMINKLENFLSRRLAETERQMLLQSTALGYLIALSKNGQTQLLLETVKLKNIVHKGKSFEQLCTDYETLKHNFDKVTDNEIAKLQFIEDKIGVYVTSAKNATIKIIKDIYYDAIINHKSKQKISQEMYDQLGFLNRSWDTIARTESNNLKNHAFIVGSLNDKGKTYFRRRVGSYNTCKICASHRDKIALWSEKPLTDDTINDELADIAIWSGKSNIGRNQKDWWIPEGSTHPNCFCEWEKLLDEEVKYFRKSIDIAKAKNPKLSEAMIGNQNARKNKVKHDGEYVLTKNGSKDFGEITKEIGRQPGKIRLRIGIHDENSDKGEGEAHIERPKRLKQLKMHGFDNARDFVEYTCNNYDEVYSSGMALLLVKKDNGFTCVVQLTPLKNDEFYDVKTVYVMPERTIKNKLAKDKIRLIWQKPNSPLSKSLSPYCLKSDNGIPTGFIKGTPDRSSIPKPINKSNKENRITTRRSC